MTTSGMFDGELELLLMLGDVIELAVPVSGAGGCGVCFVSQRPEFGTHLKC